MTQLVTRVDDELVAAVDALISTGLVSNRSEAVRVGLEQLVDRHRRDQVGAQIVAGYRALPQRDDELPRRDAAAARMIAEEPW